MCALPLCVRVCVCAPPPPGRISVKAPTGTTEDTSGHCLKNKSRYQELISQGETRDTLLMHTEEVKALNTAWTTNSYKIFKGKIYLKVVMTQNRVRYKNNGVRLSVLI